jgi:hypothetical protein
VPEVTDTKPELLAAVQAQPVGAVTLTLPGPPLEANEPDEADRENVQATPDSVTVKVLPATVSVPLLALAVLLAVTEKPTVPLPLPGVPEVTDTKPALLAAVQAQPVGAVTLTLPGPPLAPKDADVADRENVQAAPDSVTVKVLPAMVSVPLLELDELFAVTENPTGPLPLPTEPEVTDTKPALLAAVHAQPVGAVTLTLPGPPLEPKAADVAESE